MKVLIFGSSGFVGANVLRTFFRKGDEIHACVRKNSKKWRIDDLMNDIFLHVCDLSSLKTVESVVSNVRPDVVVNCTGVVSGFNFNDQKGVIQTNFINTVNLVNTCIKFNVEELINTGSAYECGFSQQPILQNECKGDPIGLYGIVKRAEREYIEMTARKFNKNYLTIRLFTPFGFFDTPIRLIPYVTISLIKNEVPRIENPRSGRDFIFIEDVANIYYRLSRKPEMLENFKVINVGTGKLTMVENIVKLLYSFAEMDYVEAVDTKTDVQNYLFAYQKETKILLSKFNLRLFSLRDALRKTFEWYSKNINYYSD